DCSLELAFLVDSSESAKENHEKEKTFVIDMVDRLPSIKLKTAQRLRWRVGLLQYSSHVIIEQTFKQWRDIETFKASVHPLAYIGHGTYTTYAITNLTQLYLEESDLNSVKVAVLLTDGVSNPRNPDIFAATTDAKNQGLRFFIVGITPAANEPGIVAKLQLLASCRIKCKERPMELVFIIDSSESVGPDNFEIIKDFVTALVDRIAIGHNATRIGIVLYSLDSHLEFNLTRYMTKEDIKQTIRKMPYIGEGTYTGTAIRHATQEAFYSARSGVRKVAIVITDGQTDKREPVKLDIAVREAHAANIEMYALGIVNTYDPTQAEFVQELNLIASDPDSEHMYLIDDFNTLTALESKLISQICEDENGAVVYNRIVNNFENGYWNNGFDNNDYGSTRPQNWGYRRGDGLPLPLSPDISKSEDRREGVIPTPDQKDRSVAAVNKTSVSPPTITPMRETKSSGTTSSSTSSSTSLSSSTSVSKQIEINATPHLAVAKEFIPVDLRCGLILDQGPCREYRIRWYYDKQANACAQFWYGGCEGNNNRFNTEEECNKGCVVSRTGG
ncbi:collagen alpha-1(XXVIII) chain-like, partial [Arapaima gigas]